MIFLGMNQRVLIQSFQLQPSSKLFDSKGVSPRGTYVNYL